MEPCRVWLRLDMPDVYLERLRDGFPECAFRRGPEAALDPAWLAGAEVVYADEPIPDAVLAAMPALRWLHVTWSGAYRFLTPSVLARPVQVTTSRGLHAVTFAEFGLACIFALAKKLPACFANQQRHGWEAPLTETVAGKTLCVVGLGVVGTELARKAHALGMQVLATKGTPGERPPFVAELGPPEALQGFLARADFVVLCLPEAPAFHGYFGEAELRAMRPSAYLINLAPKRCVDEALLVRALKERWIAGAAVDALPREPLPPESELWDLPNALVTPRVAQAIEPPWALRLPILEENLRRFLAGAPLLNAIDKVRGH
ncbi:MAG TPA: D-2-hydroxyacid dehydrogenase [Chloroflexota bacterium]|nr:D-2-hydroxyacid dehydrogenase [Chloroflexota bacterium]